MTSAAQFESDARGIEVLTSAFERALNRPDIGPNDSFFTLGGDAWAAIALFSGLSQIWGHELSPLLIFHAPTVRSLYTLLRQDPPFSVPALTLLKPGNSQLRPLFLFHGSGSTVMEFFELAKFIQSAGPIYGMQSRGTDGLQAPFQTIEEIAQYHYDGIKSRGIRGPYLLIGYSAGGLVALELARRLEQAGGEIGLFVMIDTFLPLSTLSDWERLWVKIRRKSHRTAVSMKRKFKASEQATQGIPIPNTASMRQFQELDRAALGRYSGRQYAGRVQFIRARNAWTFPLDPLKMWSPFIQQMSVETTAGDHTSLLSTHHASLGALISRYVPQVVS